ncbi:MAG: hypothetical protein IKQ91_03910 [Oscillospiraceae bacterium]|nr:hypothetical protein [Oscillospiraceae bacterium]
MIRAIILFSLTLIALLVFIALYVDETRRVQETYRTQYRTNLTKVLEDIESYQNSEGDFELRYARLISDMSAANAFIFLLNDYESQQKTINEVHTCILKYPEQMKEKLPELETAVQDILADLDQGYTEAAELVKSVDKQGH